MLERQLHGIPDTADLAVQTADVGKGDVWRLFQHQIPVTLIGQQFDGEPHGRIDDNAIALADGGQTERTGTAHQHGIAGSIGNNQTPIIEYLLDYSNLAHGIGIALFNQHKLLVEHNGGAGSKTRRIDVRCHGHNHASSAGNHLGTGMLYAVLIGVGRIDFDHRGEGERRLCELRQLRFGFGELFAGTVQSFGERMVLGHKPVVQLGKIFGFSHICLHSPIGTIRTLMRAWRYSPCCAFRLRTTVRTFFTANHTMTTTTATMTTSSNTPSAP